MKPQNFEESLIWYFIIGAYAIYALGILLPVYSLLAWILFVCLCWRIYKQPKQKIYIPKVTWIWCICMLLTLVATYLGIKDFNLGNNDLIRGVLGWLTSSAVLALFFLSGCLNIRPNIIYRAVCILCLQSLIVIPISYFASQVNVPGDIYTSPIERLIQNGPIFYKVSLYIVDIESKSPRLVLFAPWAPALGLVSNIYFFLALQESKKVWRYIGIVGAIAMNIVSVSRLALISLPLVLIIVWLLNNFTRPSTQIAAGVMSALSGIFSTPLVNAGRDLTDLFYNSRVSSSNVRTALAEIVLERWQEAPLWGHGIQEPGPLAVAKMPIGSHHTWLGLLFVKGMIGLIALIVPMLWSFVDLVIKARENTTAKVSLSILLTLFFFSFGEQIDILAYLCWPGLIVIGIAFKERQPSLISVPRENTTQSYFYGRKSSY